MSAADADGDGAVGAAGAAGPADPIHPVRRAVLALAAAGTAGVLVELAAGRHWDSAVQLVAWAAAGLLGVAVALAWRSPAGGGAAVRAARALALTVCVAAAFGIWEHVEGNYDAGPLNARYATTWATMSETSRWWSAFNGAVGAAPPIVPGALAFVALLVVAATLAPAPRRSDAGDAPLQDRAAGGPGAQ